MCLWIMIGQDPGPRQKSLNAKTTKTVEKYFIYKRYIQNHLTAFFHAI